MKKLVFILLTLAAVYACNRMPKQELPTPTFDLTELETLGPQFVGQEITLTGTIDHICKHGGGRMFLVGNDPKARIRIDAGEDMSFDATWEGNTAYITGILEELRIDSAYLAKWEQEVMEKKGSDHASKVHMGEPGHEKDEEEDNFEAELQRISDLRTKLQDSEKPYLSFFSVKCTKYIIPEKHQIIEPVADSSKTK